VEPIGWRINTVMDKCIACGASSMTVAFEKNACKILRCSMCGLGRTSPIEPTFDPHEYYSESYFQGGVSDGYADYMGSEATLRAEFRHILRYLLSLNPRRGRLLEFGCAYGFFLEEAKLHFESVQGIEISEDAVRFCHARGLDVRAGAVDHSTLNGCYDVAVGLDVIEHVLEPHETLRMIASHMNPGGVLLMTTGDWAAPLARISGPHWRLMTPPEHLSFFTVKSIRLILESAGFQLASLSHPWKRVPMSLIIHQLQRIFRLKRRQVRVLKNLWLPMNLGDAMRVVAVKY
jgi:SAM-dependent methyltransferase